MDNLDSLEQFIDLHSVSLFSAISRLSGLPDEKDIETITIMALIDLWESRHLLSKEQQPGVYTFKIMIRHIFAFLRQRGDEGRIARLQSILLVDPSAYAYTPEPPPAG